MAKENREKHTKKLQREVTALKMAQDKLEAWVKQWDAVADRTWGHYHLS